MLAIFSNFFHTILPLNSSNSTQPSSSLSLVCVDNISFPTPTPIYLCLAVSILTFFYLFFTFSISLYNYPLPHLLTQGSSKSSPYTLFSFSSCQKQEGQMTSFCEKKVHSLLSLSHSTSTGDSDSPSHHHCRNVPSTSGCFCLIAGDTQQPPNVFGSDAIEAISSPIVGKKNSNIFGLLDNVGNGLNGSCTENLGSESSDHPMEESLEEEELWRSRSTAVQSRCKMTVPRVRRQETNFPPPLPSLNPKGQPSFYLKPLRRNGRLELIEVRIQRPDIFRAFREDGRLRLQLIRSEPEHPPPPYGDDDQLEEQDSLLHSNPHEGEEDEEEEIIENLEEENIEEDDEISQEEEKGEIIENLEEEKIEEDDEISQEEEEDEEREEGNRLSHWKLDGIWRRWRCHELNNHRPNHLLFGATAV